MKIANCFFIRGDRYDEVGLTRVYRYLEVVLTQTQKKFAHSPQETCGGGARSTGEARAQWGGSDLFAGTTVASDNQPCSASRSRNS
jgi:hypothetical protein